MDNHMVILPQVFFLLITTELHGFHDVRANQVETRDVTSGQMHGDVRHHD